MLLVDAFNVIGARWVLPPRRRDLDVRGLIGLIGRSRFARRRLRVVVDGRPSPDWFRHGVYDTLAGPSWSRLGRAEVLFSGRDLEADDLIEDILARSEGLDITVVSSDRRLIAAARAAGADQIGNGAFLRQINADLDAAEAAPARPDFGEPLDPAAVAVWMKEFGFAPPADGPGDRPAGPPASHIAPDPPRPSRPRPGTPSPPTFGHRLSLDAAGLPSEPLEPRGPAEPLDPLLREAFEEWYGALHLGDLDMRKWLRDVDPL